MCKIGLQTAQPHHYKSQPPHPEMHKTHTLGDEPVAPAFATSERLNDGEVQGLVVDLREVRPQPRLDGVRAESESFGAKWITQRKLKYVTVRSSAKMMALRFCFIGDFSSAEIPQERDVQFVALIGPRCRPVCIVLHVALYPRMIPLCFQIVSCGG